MTTIQKLRTGVAAAAVVQAIQTVLFWPEISPAQIGFLLEHFLVVVVVCVAASCALGGRRNGHALAATLLVMPLAFALWPRSLANEDLGLKWAVLIVLVATTLVSQWSRWRWKAESRLSSPAPSPPSPLRWAAAGALAGALAASFRYSHAHDLITGLRQALLPGVIALTLAGGAALMRRSPKRWRQQPFAATAAIAMMLSVGIVVSNADGQAHAGGGVLPAATPQQPSGPPVVLIVLDALRADHLEAYGYERDTMPRLEQLMRTEGARAEQAVANSPYSLASHASMFTGLYPPNHGAHKPFLDDPDPPHTGLYPLSDGPPTLAELLAANGYETTAVAGNFAHLDPGLGLARGFQRYEAVPGFRFEARYHTPWCMATVVASQLVGFRTAEPCDLLVPTAPYREAGEITNAAIREVDRATGSFFLFVNYWDPHNPFQPPIEFRNAFPGRLGIQSEFEMEKRMRKGGAYDLTAAEIAHYAAAYDGNLLYLDGELDRLFQRLRQHPRWDEMLVVVTSDHGLSLGDHGLLSHEQDLFRAVTDVPLFVKPGRDTPGAPAPGSVMPGLHQSADVFPLVLSHSGVATPANIDGVAWAHGTTRAYSWLHLTPSLAESFPDRFDRELRSIQTVQQGQQDGYKLIESTSGETWLFDLTDDPQELRPLPMETHQDLRESLLQALGPWELYDSYAHADAAVSDPKLQGRLRALGYVR